MYAFAWVFFYHISVTISEYRPMCVYISFRFTSTFVHVPIRIYSINLKLAFWKSNHTSTEKSFQGQENDTHSV